MTIRYNLQNFSANAGEREKKDTKALVGDEHPAPADTGMARREEAEQIAEALARLPEHYESVLRAKYLDGLGVDEIARDRDESAKAVESLLTRARQAFRSAYMKQEGPLLHEAEP
jgi:RNA polymerase sigma factor (sigma-70 family)